MAFLTDDAVRLAIHFAAVRKIDVGGTKRVVGGSIAIMTSVVPGLALERRWTLAETYEKSGMPGSLHERGNWYIVDRHVVAEWTLARLAEMGWDVSRLNAALIKPAKPESPKHVMTSAPVPAKPARRGNGVPAKPTISKKETERRARADRRARNAERNTARRERQRAAAVEAIVEIQPAPANPVIEEPRQVAVVNVPATPSVAEQFTNDWIDSQYFQYCARMSPSNARQRVWDKIYDLLRRSGYSHPESCAEAQRAALRINQVTKRRTEQARQEVAA